MSRKRKKPSSGLKTREERRKERLRRLAQKIRKEKAAKKKRSAKITPLDIAGVAAFTLLLSTGWAAVYLFMQRGVGVKYGSLYSAWVSTPLLIGFMSAITGVCIFMALKRIWDIYLLRKSRQS